MNLAAENFLIPNGTFFVCLVIFVIVFLVIRTMVVPPILKVLDDRDAMVAKTAEDNRAAAASYEDADTEYRAALKDARADATGIRDQARAEGNEQLSDAKKRATDEADAAIAKTSEQLKAEGEQAAATARQDVDHLSSVLASRVLGTDVSSGQAAAYESTGTVK
ncbi:MULTISPECIES: F0F1 ATP synthase subunit B [unclassified Gordonia (in: high G+C Gram-positive bacteria)]|jgi:F-type H+-transporting ATPase subunit b|uniref:F0F1 ATP synthase subunit B n=1 Tax=unclassified Gordonia (in: high G+C Gram-positive bacteria) TaxID=2657482 RepID=UPI001655B765|nr:MULTISPECIES: F0F1 ATP synthase subunit B [unclassified Gordonia (in: high G+C Gram-positive bacteria)]MDL9946054.1 F0F1 ATP synthase subunit B [Gordonia sp. ABSL11-1]ROZ88920.1 F0F1 ATP synthase subunit B [Gordonia sp. OPL2]